MSFSVCLTVLDAFICSTEMPNDHTPTSSAHTSVHDIGRPVTATEHEKLDELLAQYGRRASEEEEGEGEEERQPDLRKDDMLARRTGTHQKSGGVQAFNRFLPMPGSKAQPQKESTHNGHAPRKEVVAVDGNRPRTEGYSEWNIKTARNWIGQRWDRTGLFFVLFCFVIWEGNARWTALALLN